jgi:cell division protein FtsI/penicillin-binding protein 2/cell division protein FtsW (lipid II flippase)
MAVTRSTAEQRSADRGREPSAPRAAVRGFELIWLVAASLVFGAGLWLEFQAKTHVLPGADARLVNLNEIDRREQLLPLLSFLTSPAERQFAATKIYDFLTGGGHPLRNVGAVGRIHVSRKELAANPRLESLRHRLPEGRDEVALLTPAQVAQLKGLTVVRAAGDFQRQLWLWAAVFVAGFYAVHLLWTLRGFRGAQSILPALHLLTGIGFLLMLSLRDPLRDSLSFADFALDVALGCVVLAMLSFVDYVRWFGKLSFVPLALSFVLSAALIVFGTGPGTSDAKVNLFGFQPVEAIKLLIVFFLAGYFANRWEFLRVLKDKRPGLARISRWVDVPRLEYLMPVVIAVGAALLFFFLQRDLGPALVISCLFLAIYAVARNRIVLSGFGFAGMLLGFLGGYAAGFPKTVHDRVQMWLSPWDNTVRGGEQVVHSLWALASGGLFGAGLGLGEPSVMPAAHTDLILAVLGEEWGFVGLAAVYLIYAVLIFMGLRITMRARSDYAFFLSVGLTLLVALEVLLISGGMLDLVPLSGVATPFLSYGGSAMLANFAVFAILLSLSRDAGDEEHTEPFRAPVRLLASVLGVLVLAVVAKAAWVQVVRSDAVVGAGTLTVQADGLRRYQYNPRLMEIARSIPRGGIYDRNGLPLATSRIDEVDQNRDDYARMGVRLDQTVNRSDTRYYPLGGVAFHLLGDLRTRANWSAKNSSLQERDSMVRLQGYDDHSRVVEVGDLQTGKPTYTIRHDYRELVPLLRHRHEPEDESVKRVMNRQRDVKMSIDARLQVRAARILQEHLERLKKQKGAVVVMDSDTGELLASVSYPWPARMPVTLGTGEDTPEMLDRARYGLYPPGSTFKVVTAMAALSKNPALAEQTYECKRLPDGRVGNFVRGWGRPIRDDVADKSPHGVINMQQGLVVSCNAYFAQLATYNVGAEALLDTANRLGISVANPGTARKLHDALPQAGYGQGQVVVTPLQMARVAAAIAAGGNMPYGQWVIDESNARVEAPKPILNAANAETLARYMRLVVTSGTGRTVSRAKPAIAGKTGTAEVHDAQSHAWFIGFTPYQGRKRAAFAVIVENGQYGGSAAAPIAAEVVTALNELELLKEGEGK